MNSCLIKEEELIIIINLKEFISRYDHLRLLDKLSFASSYLLYKTLAQDYVCWYEICLHN